MSIFTHKLNELDAIKKAKLLIEKNTPTMLVGLSSVAKSNVLLSFLDRFEKILVITPSQQIAQSLCDDLNQLAQSNISDVFLDRDLNLNDEIVVSNENELIRIETLNKIITNKIKIVFCSIYAACSFTCPSDIVKSSTIAIDKSKKIDRTELIGALNSLGFLKRQQVDQAGQFAIRGSIIDIFPLGYSDPLRLDFFGDSLESIVSFDLDTQKRIEEQDNVSIIQSSEFFATTEILINKLEKILKSNELDLNKNIIESDLDSLKSSGCISNIDKYIPIIYDTPTTIFDYFKNSLLAVSEYIDVKETAISSERIFSEDIVNIYKNKLPFCDLNYSKTFSEISSMLEKKGLFLNTFDREIDNINIKNKFYVATSSPPYFAGKVKDLVRNINSYLKEEYTVVVMAGTKRSSKALADDLESFGVVVCPLNDISSSSKYVRIVSSLLSQSVEYPDAKLIVITKAKIAQATKKIKNFRKGEDIHSLVDLKKGDFVVHLIHGIGKFDGVAKLKTQGVFKDYIKVQYKGDDILYLSVTQLDMISKYIGADAEKVKLNRLGGEDFKKTQNKVKDQAQKLAKDLIELYAVRENTKGFAFSKDNEWMKNFEQHFEYDETEDQLNAIREIKNDMQKSRPMDRLLCGDVGFGKTEVALRAAFKAVLDSKQVAILCPTTILALQHFDTLSQRIGDFPINIELLSRFRTKKEQKLILDDLKNNKIDIIIGTHRLVQNDVEFYDLGLAIIDEEQRFGVSHKEKFKKLFKSVDVLSLSATPIPRTLNMAMSGIRDISVLDKPPHNRQIVQTYVVEYKKELIAAAIKRELLRNGQVYYIHNKIETIDATVSRVKSMAPKAKIGVAHGRMEQSKLARVWKQLIDHDIDILVSTTIVETGVDLPNVNTLIVENSDLFGLSQLYQLRGRVGRSKTRAFAYFTFFKGKVLSEIASKRLAAIREFTKFGSGFKIALRDLEIRGAGSFLGKRQHGQMEAVGYDMYLRILSQEIKRLQGKKVASLPSNCVVELPIGAHIPANYIPSLEMRLDMYRKISTLKTKTQKKELLVELKDRFGNPPKAVLGLIKVAMLRAKAINKKYTEISMNDDYLRFYPQKIDDSLIENIQNNLSLKVYVNRASKPYFDVLVGKNDIISLINKILSL